MDHDWRQSLSGYQAEYEVDDVRQWVSAAACRECACTRSVCVFVRPYRRPPSSQWLTKTANYKMGKKKSQVSHPLGGEGGRGMDAEGAEGALIATCPGWPGTAPSRTALSESRQRVQRAQRGLTPWTFTA